MKGRTRRRRTTFSNWIAPLRRLTKTMETIFNSEDEED